MIACPKCAIKNTLDSMFCRKCGYAMPHDLMEEEQIKLKDLVSKGMHAFSDGNTEEAMGIAEHAVMANPALADGHALKGMVHERRGEYAQALDSFETVVALNPDSTIDKIKLNQLRNAFAQRTAEPKVDRKGAAIMALAATLLVASVGAITYRVATTSNEVVTPGPGAVVAKNPGTQVATNTPQNPGTISNPAPSNTQGNQVVTDGSVKPLRSGEDNDSDQRSSGSGLPRPIRNGNRSNSMEGELTTFPVIDPPEGPIGKTGKTLPPTNGQQGGGVPTPKNPPTQSGPDEGPSPTIPITKAEDPGQIDIRISPGKNGNSNNSEAVRRTGNERMRSGDAEGAASAYEKAAQSGGGKGHQRRAQAYAAQGKKAEAADAYRKAIDAYEADIKAGRGNADSNQAGLNSCRQALRAIGS